MVTQDDPERPGERKLSFHAVEGFQPPAAIELATTAAPDAAITIAEPPAATE